MFDISSIATRTLYLCIFMVAQIQVIPDVKLVVPATVGKIFGTIQIFTAPEGIFYVEVFAQAVRLGGQGTGVLIAQFFKGGINQGVKAPRRLGQNLEWLRCDLGRNIEADTDITAVETEAILDLWSYVKLSIVKGKRELIILDGLNLLISRAMIAESEIIDVLKARRGMLDIILTGANMPKNLMDIADQVTQRRR